MLRRSLVQFRHAYDLLRRGTVSAVDAARRLGNLFFLDETRAERLVLVRSTDKTPHFRRLPCYPGSRRNRAFPPGATRTPHQRAVHRLRLELEAGEGLSCVLHDGMVVGPAAKVLVGREQRVRVKTEQSVRIAGRRFAPDILICCHDTDAPLIAIEVCASHPVGAVKRAAYEIAGLTWIEVRAMHTVRRFRKQPLCAENWNGRDLPMPPHQRVLPLAFKVAASVPLVAQNVLKNSSALSLVQ